MVRVFVVLGFALLAGGVYAIVDGWPYRVLESGFTEVILGGLSLVAGLILLALAAVLAEVRRLKGLVSGAMAAIALSEPRSGERLEPSEVPARSEPALGKAPAPEAGHVGIATTLAAGAGAVAAGALTGLVKSEEVPEVKATDKAEEGDGARSDRVETVAAEPSQAPLPAVGDLDDWLLPPVSPVLDAAPSDVRSDDRGESDEADEKVEEPQDEPERPVSSGAEKADEKADDVESVTVALGEPEARQAEEERSDSAEAEIASASSPEDRLWWPRIDRPAKEEPTSVDDEFNALRDQLVGVVNAPEVEPPRRDRDTLDTTESWIAPRPWPPVTQPRDPGALGEVEVDVADKASPEDAKTEPVSADSEPAAPEPESEPLVEAEEPASTTSEMLPAEKHEPSAAETRPDEEPAASEEGVIGAYQVGETQFTMFADGSIHARTPDGDYVFASMEELKAYLASEKDKIETSSN